MSEEPKPVKPPRTLEAFAEMMRAALESNPSGLTVIQRPSNPNPTNPPTYKFFFKRPVDTSDVLDDEEIEEEEVDEEEDDGWEEIASGDDNISDELLDWSGLKSVWKKYSLREFECFQALAVRARHLSIESEGWGGDAPGLSGSWKRATTDDRRALERELRSLVAVLIWHNRAQIHTFWKR